MKRNHAALVGLGCGLAGALGAGVGAGTGAAPGERAVAWEYGELVVEGNRVLLITERIAQEVEIPLVPADQSTTFKNETGPFKRRFEPLLFGLNVLGREGWEIVDAAPLRNGDRVLVRRRN